MIKSITVQLYVPTQIGTDTLTDEFDIPICTETPVNVPGVLVYPSSNDAVVTDLQLYGKKSVYQLCIPKGDTHQWEDRKVGFFGKLFRTFGPCAEYIDGNIPLKWNKQIRVERYE